MAELSKQHWSAERYAATAHFVPAFGAPVVELLDPQPGERILDLGCGDGVLTEKIAALGARVVAVDAAPDMVAAAKARGLDARVVPGQSLAFDREFDAVFSNAALHWMRPQEAVLDGVRRALKPGGRFVAEMGGHNNTAAMLTAMRAVLARRGIEALSLSPWYFPPRPLRIRRSLRRPASRSRRSRSFRGRRRSMPAWTLGSTRSQRIS
jgi:trans-aconitate methyltransferase